MKAYKREEGLEVCKDHVIFTLNWWQAPLINPFPCHAHIGACDSVCNA